MCSFFLVCFVNPKSLEDGGGGGVKLAPLELFGFKFFSP